MTPVLITKASGEKQPFDESKLRRSLLRSGAPADVIDTAVSQVVARLRPEMTTREIYRLAFGFLKKRGKPLAARYSLKQAIIELGPSGHPFEKLVGEVLKAQGYSVKVAQTVRGKCVSHEVDVVAEKGDRHIMAECKFHHERGLKVDVKVALYIRARFEDVEKAWRSGAGHARKFHEAWLITNAKLTTDAIRYSECVGLKAVGWDYPAGGSLPELIERAGLHPVTALTGLSRLQKRQLVDKGIILCTELTGSALGDLGLPGDKVEGVLKERGEICRLS